MYMQTHNNPVSIFQNICISYLYAADEIRQRIHEAVANRSQTITKKYVGQQIYNHQGQQAQSDVVALSMS